MNRNYKGLIILAVVVVVAFFGIKAQLTEEGLAPEANLGNGAGIEDLAEKEAILIINKGEKPQTFSLEVKEGITVFDFLKQSGLDIDYAEYGAGVFIKAIEGVENGEDGRYWLYYVNGEMPEVSVDKKEIEEGDRVEFKFEESSF